MISILNQFGFTVQSQRGSHAKLRRVVASGSQETLTVPVHGELELGTLRAIFRQASRYVPEEQLFPLFYSD